MLSGWGRVPVPGREVRSEDLEALTRDAVLCRGLGRSYGDSSLPPPGRPVVAGTPLADRILAFEGATGRLRAEAGFSLFDLNRIFLARGFCAPVAPGTQFITLGGMVAADVHGKNHHRDGCFGRHVSRLRMRVADGTIVECSPEHECDLFRATLGGMGLTGHILEVECRLTPIPSPWIWRESERIADIDRFIEALKEAGPRWPYTMGWIDCLSRGRSLGRGILMRGRWAERAEAPPDPPRPKSRPAIPFVFPGWVISRASVRAFNALYYHRHRPGVERGIVHPESFLYPLDVIRHWNRMYGPRGFTQYQCVLPDTAGHGAARRFLELLTSRGGASMLCVIKDCGDEGPGLLSFPLKGISIALDIPIRDDTQSLVDALNELVIAEGGRIYLAKDAFTRPDHFRAMEPRLPEWTRIRRHWDPQGQLRSAQSVRMLGDRP
ncbi:MAG TPA: FAD-binding oxidoreductase [Vicinamibacteria bacterium]|nr:FAD-binding oxidoreductase [Vicinamibacteria bacterium]